ncbi:RsiV family protein [Chryseobacterium camelliae]|uniref:RsiV family protein n=1 Tax=Chryseobacterium camelliae TaxID=1265445 RepID=UPI000C1C8662|nr:RsiV family protein [Chryseobacterium camelliae]
MKNILAAITLAALFSVSACKKSETSGTSSATENSKPGTFRTDSVAINDSVKLADSLTVQYSAKLLVFPSLQDKTLLDSIYFNRKVLKDFSQKGLQAYLEKDKNGYFDKLRKESKEYLSDIRFGEKWYTDTSMHLKSVNNDFMHIQYMWGSYEGGAHDNYGFSERVFDLKNNKKLELKDITTMPAGNLEALLMKNINKINSGTTDNKGQVNNSEMLLVEVIPATDNFYFDDKNLYFHYSPYEIAAFAAGDITIPVSWQELDKTLTPAFRERMKFK